MMVRRTDSPPRIPAPPLFPRHRRGIYRNAQGVEVIDATPQSPPLDTGDPAVPDVAHTYAGFGMNVLLDTKKK
jgi:hypothetical protein